MELENKDEAFNWLEKAFEMRDSGITYIKVYPGLEKFREDSRFDDLLRRMNLEGESVCCENLQP